MGSDGRAFVYFLLVFSLAEHRLESHKEFDDSEAALSAYAAAEDLYLGKGYEVVLVGSESIETVMLTHGSYFEQATVPAAGLSYSLS